MNFDPEFLFPDHISLGNLRYIFKIFLDKFEEVPDIPVLRWPFLFLYVYPKYQDKIRGQRGKRPV